MHKYAIFDLDGTLLDTLPALASAGNQVCRKHGWPEHALSKYRRIIGGSLSEFISEMLPRDFRSEEIIEESSAQVMDCYKKECLDLVQPFPFLPEALLKLKKEGIVLAVLTNTVDGMAKELIARHYQDTFTYVQGACPGVPHKPDPALLHLLMKKLEAQNDGNTLLIGDSEVDIQTANRASLPCCGVSWGYRGKQHLLENGATHLADSADELIRIVLEK